MHKSTGLVRGFHKSLVQGEGGSLVHGTRRTGEGCLSGQVRGAGLWALPPAGPLLLPAPFSLGGGGGAESKGVGFETPRTVSQRDLGDHLVQSPLPPLLGKWGN